MNTYDGTSRRREDRSATDGAGYRWTCPLCGRTEVNRLGGDDDGRHAVAALRSHIASSGDEDHGPPNAAPPDLDLDDLEAFVEPVG